MKQILLIDDDFLSLNAFYALADWRQYGLQIAYEAHNAREALHYLKQCAAIPDIAFIDVCMPDMDGITLLTRLRELYPDMLFIMLSAYSDYPYVRQALKLGAADYLLKHELTPESIIDLLTQHNLCAAHPCEETPAQSRLQDALEGAFDAPMQGYMLYARYQDERPLLDAQLRPILHTCRHILNAIPGSAVCAMNDEELVFFFPATQGREAAEDHFVHQQSAVLKKALMKYHNARYAFLPAHRVKSAAQMRSIYLLLSQKQESVCASSSFLVSRADALLTLAVTNGENTLIEKTLRTLFADLPADHQALHTLCNHLLTLLAHIRQTCGLPAERPPEISRSPAQAQTEFIRLFASLCRQNTVHLSRRYSPGIYDAIEYINHNYAKDIHLNDIARHCHLSYAHLSYLFKKETRENIISYLNRIRIYHASLLLIADNLSVSHVCQQVGFKGYNHFVTLFKSITGITPSEFRKNPSSVDYLLNFPPLGLSQPDDEIQKTDKDTE